METDLIIHDCIETGRKLTCIETSLILVIIITETGLY